MQIGNPESMTGFVIQATRTVEFEDGLRLEFSSETASTLALFRPHLAYNQFQPPLGYRPSPLGVWLGPEGNVVVMYGPCQTKVQLCQVLPFIGIKLQLVPPLFPLLYRS